MPALKSAHPCGEEVCLSTTDTIAMSRFMLQASLTQRALEGCSLVQLVDE